MHFSETNLINNGATKYYYYRGPIGGTSATEMPDRRPRHASPLETHWRPTCLIGDQNA